MRTIHLAWLLVAGLTGTSLVAQAPAHATARCKDGTYSYATTASGMCSAHGGVAKKLAAKPAAPPAGATARCQDGTYSSAQTTRGACSQHGGVAETLERPTAAARKPASPVEDAPSSTVRRPGDAPVGATARCRDGTYSESQNRSGTCSHHKGVAEWYW